MFVFTNVCRKSGIIIGGCGTQPLRIHVDNKRGEQNEAADQDLEEAVNVYMVEAIVQDAEDEQSDNGVPNPSTPTEQAGSPHHDSGNPVEQISIELVLLGRAEMGDAEHACQTAAEG